MVNPLFGRLTHRQNIRSGLFNLAWTLWFAVPIAIGLIICEGGDFEHIRSTLWDPFALGCAWLVCLLAPIAVAAVSAELTSRDTSNESYKLVCLSPLSNRRIIAGYFVSSLYRARVALLVVLLVIPMIGTAWLRSNLLARVDCTGSSDFYETCPGAVPPTLAEWVGWSVVSTALVVSLFGMNLVAASIGVAAGLWFRKPVGAVFIAPASYAVVSMLILAAYGFCFNEQTLIISSLPSLIAFRFVIASATVGMLIPYVVTVAIQFAAETWTTRKMRIERAQ